jgi:hypothetical protein
LMKYCNLLNSTDEKVQIKSNQWMSNAKFQLLLKQSQLKCELLRYWYSNANNLECYENVENKQECENNHENNKNKQKMAYFQWLTHTGFQTEVLIAKFMRNPKRGNPKQN